MMSDLFLLPYLVFKGSVCPEWQRCRLPQVTGRQLQAGSFLGVTACELKGSIKSMSRSPNIVCYCGSYHGPVGTTV